jgi:hypothetical protein
MIETYELQISALGLQMPMLNVLSMCPSYEHNLLFFLFFRPFRLLTDELWLVHGLLSPWECPSSPTKPPSPPGVPDNNTPCTPLSYCTTNSLHYPESLTSSSDSLFIGHKQDFRSICWSQQRRYEYYVKCRNVTFYPLSTSFEQLHHWI